MSAQKHSPTSRFLRFLKTKAEPGSKGNTIKKAVPRVSTGESVQDASGVLQSDKDSTFSRKNCNPRSVSESFVVGEVRKISYNGSPPDSIKAQEQLTKTAAAAPSESTTDTKHAADSSGNSEKFPALAARSDTPVALITATRTDAHPQSVPNGVNGKCPQPAFDLLLGQQDSTSPYFTRRYFSTPYVAAAGDATEPPADVLHHLSELDPQAFEVYQMYTNTGRIGFKCPADVKSKYMWVACWPLMNAHILGCIIEEPAFADRVMDNLAEKLPPGLAPDFKTVEQLFDGSRIGVPDVLLRFVADRFVTAQQQSHVVLDTSKYPDSFRETALQSALWHLTHSQQAAAIPACIYHTHRDKEVCYKTKLTPVDTLKEQRLAAARDKSARDAKFVIANALQNGVKSVDWEQHGATARQKLRIDTGQARMGFRPREIGNQAVWDESTSEHINGARNSAHNTTPKDQIPSANPTRYTYNLTRTPNSSPVLQSRSTKTHLITDPGPHVSPNGQALSSELADTPMVTPSQTPHAFLLAELDGNSINITRPTPLAVKYRSSVDRRRASMSHDMTSLAATNVAGERDNDIDSLGDVVTASDRRIGELTTEYERSVGCPGAYPRSDIG